MLLLLWATSNTTRINSPLPSPPFICRACAASHLHVWRAIDALRKQKHPSLPSPPPQTTNEDIIVNDELVGLVKTAQECFSLSRMGGGWLPLQKKPPSLGASTSGIMDVSGGTKGVLGHGTHRNHTGHSGAITPWGEEQDDWYLILEDDAEVDQSVLSQELQIEINKLIHQKVPSTFDVLYLGGVVPHSCREQRIGTSLQRAKYVWCLHAYVLRGRAVTALLRNLPINAPVDNFVGQLAYDGTLEVYTMVTGKMLFRQRRQQTSSAGSSSQYRKYDTDITHSGKSTPYWERGRDRGVRPRLY